MKLTVLISLLMLLQVLASEQSVSMPQKYQKLFDTYCLDCHNAKKKKGKVRLDKAGFSFEIKSIQDADKWHKILEAMNSKEMPPEDEPQVPEIDKADFLETLSKKLVEARSMLSDSGGKTVMRRMNRREYQQTMKNLLGVDVDAADLPSDKGSGFDTDGASLFMSSGQIEVYRELAKKAVFNALTGTFKTPLRLRREVEIEANKQIRKLWRNYYLKGYTAGTEYFFRHSKNKKVKATQFGLPDENEAKFRVQTQWRLNIGDYVYYTTHPLTQSGILLTIDNNTKTNEETLEIRQFQESKHKPKINTPFGLYKLRLRVGTTPEATPENSFIEMHIDGKLVKTFHVSSPASKPMIIEVDHNITKETDRVITFKPRSNPKAVQRIIQRSKIITGKSPAPSVWIDWVEWEGPFKRQTVLSTRLQKLVNTYKGDTKQLNAAFTYFARQAFKGRQPSTEYIDKLIKIFRQQLKNGKNKAKALEETLAVVLSSPSFLYMPETHTGQKKKLLEKRELAVKLASFLWSSPPDKQLLQNVNHEDLSEEVKRMMQSPQLDNFVKSFLHQWLHMDRLDFFQFDIVKYPFFDESLKAAARNEVYETFKTILLKNLDSKNLLKSDFVVVDALMADYYGLKGVQGDKFQQIKLPKDSPRGGFLGMVAILAMGSNGEHTSPVERGAWILRMLLNDPPPPAPANVPQLSRLEGKNLNIRQLIEAHQEDAQCAHCHRKIDPLGFGLENFDAVGRWRTMDDRNKKKIPVNPSGKFHNGPSFKTYFELRNIVASKVDDFNKGMAKAMLEYALGRKVGFTDQQLIDEVFKDMKKQGNSLQALIIAIVNSEAFRSKK